MLEFHDESDLIIFSNTFSNKISKQISKLDRNLPLISLVECLHPVAICSLKLVTSFVKNQKGIMLRK